MSIVYYLQHRIQYATRADRKGIGAFRSFAKAQAAIKQVGGMPGFKRTTGRFSIYACELDRTYLPDGLDTPSNLANGDVPGRNEFGPNDDVYVAYWDDEDRDDVSVQFGYYSTRDLAQAALVEAEPHIPDAKRGVFDVSTSRLDRVEWSEGFGSDDDE